LGRSNSSLVVRSRDTERSARGVALPFCSRCGTASVDDLTPTGKATRPVGAGLASGSTSPEGWWRPVAKGAASVVLTDPGLTNIVALVEQGRTIYQRILTWIINKISQTILKSAFVSVAFLVTGKFVVVSVRERRPFWSSRPSQTLLAASLGPSSRTY
jgi:hypothetical protein